MKNLCPCDSKKTYDECCKIFHEGSPAQNALQLMRSRYAAYALQKADYIMHTTHPSNPHFKHNKMEWKQEILAFCQQTKFEGLNIIEFIDGEKEAFVTFLAKLSRKKQNVSFVEKSLFEKINGQWLYKSGVFK